LLVVATKELTTASLEHYRSRENFTVREISIGDYVLNGGEVAALVILEAVIRLIPGVIGNPASLEEESHSILDVDERLVEYPSYTKPAIWRGLEVPSGLTLWKSWRDQGLALRAIEGSHQEIERVTR
jgi:tRNA (guanine-N1)-methyltransferase